jgi:hypothetical protein
MPSIPQSLLWISLVVLWLFVLVPMLISKRDAVRRTSDVALATRVLNSGRAARLLRRSGPAAGHRSDPDWRPSGKDVDDEADDIDDKPGSSVVAAAASLTDTEPGYLDVDIVEKDSGALPVGASAPQEPEPAPKPEGQGEELSGDSDDACDEHAADQGDAADEYEYVADSSGLEAPSDNDLQLAESMTEARRRRYESKTAAAVSARKYKFRKRVLALLVLALMASAVAGYLAVPSAWWACGSTGALTLLYLAYLRRQTRIEERLRRRRAQRMMRSRLGVESTDDRKLDVVPSRLRQPGSVVLEIDDEDPIFEHLEHAPLARHFDLPRAAGQ